MKRQIFSLASIKAYAGAIDVNVLSYFSQLFFGTIAGLLLTNVWKGLPKTWGIMTIFTYWGGHGAATSAGTLFEELGENGMLSIGLILATLGLVIAMLAGMVWVNIGARAGWAPELDKASQNKSDDSSAYIPEDQQKSLGRATVASDAINGLALQLCFVFLSMWIGSLIFTTLAKLVPATSDIPSLLYGIVGAIIVWIFLTRTHLDKYADKVAVDNIGGVALEICICSATATLDLNLFASFLAPILIHMAVVLAIISFLCMFLIRRWFGEDWFPMALMIFGGGTGSTPSGLALARCVDPNARTSAWEAYGVAQGCFVPVTSTLVAIIPVLAMKSIWIPVAIGGIVTLVCVLFGELVIRRQNH